MELKRIWKVLIVLLVSSGLSLTACGGDEKPSEDKLNVGEETEDDTGGEDPGGEEPGGEEPGGEEPGGGEDDGPKIAELADPPPSCDSADPPPRCKVEEPDDFEDFGPASLFTELKIADEGCCFDLNPETPGQDDNALAGVIEIASSLGEVNQALQESINDGTVTIILEHDGLEEIAAGAEYNINFLLGEKVDDDGDETNVDVVSFEQGVYPHAMLPGAKITEENGELRLDAGPGTVIIELHLFDVDLRLSIRNAMIRAYPTGTNLDGGLNLEDGSIGGIILFDELVDAVNDVASNCDCLGNPTTLYDVTKPQGEECADYTEQLPACAGEGFCKELAEFCGSFSVAKMLAADVYTTPGSTLPDAFSVGLTFKAKGTQIVGTVDNLLADEGDDD